MIYDCLGDAELVGEIGSSGDISFQKKYFQDKSSPSAAKKAIKYKGEWQGDHIEGNFGSALLPYDRFFLYPFSLSLRLIDTGFVDEDSWDYRFYKIRLDRELA